MANLNQQYSEIRRAYYENFMAFKHSDAYKSLPAEQKFQVDKTAKETWQAISDAEKASAPVDAQEERANRGILKNIVTDTTSGMLNVGRSGASLAAWGADVAGLPDVAKPLDQISKDLGDTSQRIAPAANPDNLIDFGSQSLLQNLPMLATAGIAGEVMAGSEAGGAALHALRSAAGVPAAAGAAPLSEAAGSFLGTLGTYGVPSIRQANVEAGAENRGGMVGDGNPYFELAAAVPYALIENTLGVTPLKTMRAFSGRAASTGITKTLTASAGKIGALLEKPLFELSGKAGLRGTIGAFARFVADNILGEATEEVLQGIEEIAIPHFAKKPINQAIRDTIAELGKPETFENLKTQALGGGIVGTLLGGGNVLMRKIANITAEINNPDTTPEEAQRLADLKTQFKAELLQLTDHAGMPNVTDNTTENFQEPGDWQSIHPQQILGAPAPEVTYPDGVQPQNIGTEGSMDDYTAYKQAKSVENEPQPKTSVAIAKKLMAIRDLPDTDPRKIKFLQFLADRGLLPQEQTEYPAGPEGDALRQLDNAEIAPESFVTEQAAPQTELLDYQPGKTEGRTLADNGGVILPAKTSDIITLKSGQPFSSQKAAKGYQAKNNLKDSHDVVPVRGGFALMKKPSAQKPTRISTEKPTGNGAGIIMPDQPRAKMRLSGRGDASRIEKTLTQEKPYVTKEPESNIRPTGKESLRVEPEPSRGGLRRIIAESNTGKWVLIRRKDGKITSELTPTNKSTLSVTKFLTPNGYFSASEESAWLGGSKELTAKVFELAHKMEVADNNREDYRAVVRPMQDQIRELIAGSKKSEPAAISPKPAPEVTQEKPDVTKKAYTEQKPAQTYSVGNKAEVKTFYADIPVGTKGDVVKHWRDNTGKEWVTLFFGKNQSGQSLKKSFPVDVLTQPASAKKQVYTYGLRARPLSLGTVPKGFVAHDSEFRDSAQRIRHGVVVYDRKLTPEEVKQFELIDMNEAEKSEPGAASKQPAATPGKIEDFGEKLGGAKKDKAQSAMKDLSDDDLRKMPLSAIWPKSEIDNIEDTRAAAFATAARAEIPTKPRKAYALERWVEKIKTVRSLTQKFTDNPEEIFTKMKASPSLAGFITKVELLEQLPRESWGRIGEINFYPNAYAYGEDGEKIPKPSFNVRIDGRSYSRSGTDMNDLVSLAKEKLGAEQADVSKMKFEVRGSRRDGIFKINKKGDPLYRTLKVFTSSKEALDFVRNNGKELVAAWEDIKAAENVTEGDVRRKENRTRSGEDYRNNKNVTPEQFSETFGFRGVEFGNWVSQGKNQKERQGMLNIAYDSFMDLAKILNVPPKALSLNSTLGIGFGSRGSGKASAHYEPTSIIINLTKTKGAGSLAHEWFHALDNYFSRERGGENKVLRFEGANAYRDRNYVTHKPEPLYINKKNGYSKLTLTELETKYREDPTGEYFNPKNWQADPEHPTGVRTEVEKTFAALVRALDESPMTSRSRLIDKGKSRGYWSSTLERAARAFEVYTIETLADEGKHNDYLANVVSAEEFSMDPGRYPYLLPAEAMPVKTAFKELFQTVKAEKTDKGVKLYSVEAALYDFAVKYGKPVARAGWKLFKRGATKFTAWAKSMLKQFGSKIGKQLRSLYADLQAFNKRLGKEGMIKMGSLGRPGFQRMAVVPNTDRRYLRFEEGAVYFDENNSGLENPTPRTIMAGEAFRQNSAAVQDVHMRSARRRNRRFKAQQEKAIAEARAKDPAWREFLGVSEKHYQDNETAKAVAQWQEENPGAIFSVEYLVAKYSYKYAKAGYKLFRDGITTFAKWAKQMSLEFGKSVHALLKNLYADLQSLNKKLGRTGAISGRGSLPSRPTEAKDFKWKKEDSKTAKLEYTSPDTGNVGVSATLKKNAKNQWEWIGTNKAFLTLTSAAKQIKDTILTKIKASEAEQRKTQRVAAEKRAKKDAKTEAYFAQPPAAKKLDIQDLPQSSVEKIQHFAERLTVKLADDRHVLKTTQDLVELNRGRPLPDNQNAYQMFETISGRIEEKTKDFKDKYWKPMEDYLVKHKISYEDFNNFLYAMHARERNAYVDSINPAFREKNVAGSGWTNEKAEEVKAELFAKHGEDTLMTAGKMIWEMHSRLLDEQVKYGDINEQVKDIVDAKYEYYSPLKRIPDDAEPFLLDKRAMGRRSEAEHILAFSEAAIDTTFRRGENNAAMQAVARMMLLNPAYELYEIDKGKVEPFFNDKTGEIEYRHNKFANRNDVIHTKFDGKSIALLVKDKGLFNAIKRKKFEPNVVFKVSRMLNKPIAITNTALSPGFIPVNLFRDSLTAFIHTAVKYSPKMAKDILAGIPSAIKTAWQSNVGIDNENTRLFKEYSLAGGKTGFSEIYRLEEYAGNLEKQINERINNGAWYKTKKFFNKIGDLVKTGNDIVESATRFSGYMVAKKAGMSNQKSAAFAKNLTVNFNKRGEWGNAINSLYVFGNASIQGGHMVAKVTSQMTKTQKGKAALISMIALGAAVDLMNRMLSDYDDDDEKSYYDKIDSPTKDNHLIIMLPHTGGNYVSLPLPYGFNILPAVGRNASSLLFGDKGLIESVSDLLGLAVSSFSPIGNDNRGIIDNITPTAIKPFTDIKSNTKWTGRKIRPDQPVFGAKVPRNQLYYEQTSKQLAALTKWLSEATGGDEYKGGVADFSPADIQYLFETYSGGLGKFIGRSVDTIGRVSSGEPVQIENVPIIRRFVGKARDYNVYDDFRKNVQIAQTAQLAKREKNVAWLRNNRHAIKIEAMLKQTRKIMEKVEESKLSTTDKKARLLQEQKKFNKKVQEIKK